MEVQDGTPEWWTLARVLREPWGARESERGRGVPGQQGPCGTRHTQAETSATAVWTGCLCHLATRRPVDQEMRLGPNLRG